MASISEALATKLVDAATLPQLLAPDWGVNVELCDALANDNAERCAGVRTSAPPAAASRGHSARRATHSWLAEPRALRATDSA